MTSCAGLTGRWLMRFGIMTLMMAIFAGYFGYDGFVRYPRQNRIWETYQKYKDKPDEWEDVADRNGWPLTPPENRHTQTSIMTQRGIAMGCAVLAVATLAWIGISAGKKISADATGITAGQTRIAYDRVRHIDKSRWDSKGIAVVHYQADGREGTITIDDYKYRGGQAVLSLIEQHVQPAQSQPATEAESSQQHSDREGQESSAEKD